MSLIVFPAIGPSKHPVVTGGEFPHVTKRATAGRSARIRLSNVNLNAEINLIFENIDTQQLLQLWGHWNLARGLARDFALHPAVFPSLEPTTRARLLATAWRFKEAPKITDICGGEPGFLLHSLEITLRSQPRRVLSPVSPNAPQLSLPVVPVVAPGARWSVSTTWQPGAGGINQLKAPGAQWSASTYWEPGAASIQGSTQAPGAQWTVSTSWAPGSRTTPGANWSASTSWAPGEASSVGAAPGANWSVSTSWTPGAASVPPTARPGANWTASTTWTPGAATIQGLAPGASWSASTTWTPGRGQAIAPGAAWTASTTWAPGSALMDPSFSSVELLLNMQGANGSTSFIDSSSNGFIITRFGGATIQDGAFSGDGDGDFLLTPQSSELVVGTDDFTLEAFAEPTTVNPANWGLFNLVNATGDENFASLGVAVFNGNWGIKDGGGYFSRGAATAGARVHVALTRSSGVVRLWVGGAQLGATLSNSSNLTNNRIIVGNYNASSSAAALPGKIGPFRFTRGVARYTATFTPPSGTFPTQ